MKLIGSLLISIIALTLGNAQPVAARKTEQLPKISIFCDHLESIVKQENIPFRDVAVRIWDMGYRGIDVRVTQNPEELAILKELGFTFASVITELHYVEGDQSEMEQRTLDFLKEYDCPRVMAVLGFLKKGQEEEGYAIVRDRLSSFVKRAVGEGITVMVEDYDHRLSPSRDMERIQGLLDASPELTHAFDSGNYFHAAEDCLEALDRFSSKIAHVHFKDRVSAADLSCPPLGEGCIPIAQIIKTLKSRGYDGWYTIEFFGNKNMLVASQKSYDFISSCLKH